MKKILVIILLMFPLCIYAQSDALVKFNDLKEIVNDNADEGQKDILEKMFAINATVINDTVVGNNKEMTFPFMVLFLSKEDFFKVSHVDGVRSFTNINILYYEPFFHNGVKVQKIMIREDWYLNLEEDSFVMNDILNYITSH